MDQSSTNSQDRCSDCHSRNISYFDISTNSASYICQDCSHVDTLEHEDSNCRQDNCFELESGFQSLAIPNVIDGGKANLHEDENRTASNGIPSSHRDTSDLDAMCRCEFTCGCGNKNNDHFVHHQIAYSFHVVECIYCNKTREFGQTKQYIAYHSKQEKETPISEEHAPFGNLILICRQCGNMDSCTFLDIRDGSGDLVTYKQCGWCDDRLPIRSGGFRDEQTFLSSPCSFCENNDPDSFLFTFGSDGYVTRKECHRCQNTDIRPNEQPGPEDGIGGIDEQLTVDAIRNSHFTCPQCRNIDLYHFSVVSIDNGEPIIQCDACKSTSNLDGFLQLQSQISPSSEGNVPEDVCTEGNICSCGDGKGQYVTYEDDTGKLMNVVCKVCYDYVPFYHFVDGKDHSRDRVGYPSPKTRIWNIHHLRPGDHIMYHRSTGYYHHEIIADIYHKERSIKNARVIHFTGIERNDEGGALASSFSSVNGSVKGQIKEEDKYIDCQKETVYRVNYEKSVCFEPNEVVTRAQNRIGETKYNILTNNCEHFARWCKTGERRSLQTEHVVQWMKDSVSSASKRITYTRPAESTLHSVVEAGISKGAQETAKTVVSKAVGACAVVAVEILNAKKEISRAGKQLKEGNITREEFQNITERTQYKATGGAIGAIAGGAALSFIPIAGNFIGSTVGGIVGNILGVHLHSTFKNK